MMFAVMSCLVTCELVYTDYTFINTLPIDFPHVVFFCWHTFFLNCLFFKSVLKNVLICFIVVLKINCLTHLFLFFIYLLLFFVCFFITLLFSFLNIDNISTLLKFNFHRGKGKHFHENLPFS